MKLTSANGNIARPLWIGVAVAWVCLCPSAPFAGQQSAEEKALPATAASTAGARTFDTPQQAAAALLDAAEKFDEQTLLEIFGPDGEDIVLTGEYPQDRQRAIDFAAEAREKQSVSVYPKNPYHAILVVGNENWPFPVPMVKRGAKWSFDAKAGRRELLYRRIGHNELDAIQICRGYVEAHEEYALKPREGYDLNQYAQRIVSTPGTQNGLAWQNPDGTWGGPIGEKIAHAIEQGYTSGADPYHGYFFKILNGQGPAAPLGQMDFVVKGVMIGSFALVAAPAEYRITGVNTFIVSHNGIVYQKDLGPASLEKFKKMELFNPDKSWIPVREENEEGKVGIWLPHAQRMARCIGNHVTSEQSVRVCCSGLWLSRETIAALFSRARCAAGSGAPLCLHTHSGAQLTRNLLHRKPMPAQRSAPALEPDL